jgi:cytidylate kinase
MKFHKRDEKWARETIQEQDKAKAALTKTFFNRDIQDPLLYDFIWNTDRVAIDDIARVIIDTIKKKALLMK